MSNEVGVVYAVFIKPAKGVPMIAPLTNGVTMQTGHGIIGDVNAHPMSPRQVLITRREDLSSFGLASGDLRENIVIEGLEEKGFEPGAVLNIGPSVRIRLTFHCEPCKRIEHLVSLHDIRAKRGILGVVLQGGDVTTGHQVISKARQFSPLPDMPYERFLSFVSQIPKGCVVTYREVLIGMGVAESYARAIPNYIRRTSPIDFPVHRIVDTRGELILDYIPQQLEKLREENLVLEGSVDLFGQQAALSVDIKRYRWYKALYLE